MTFLRKLLTIGKPERVRGCKLYLWWDQTFFFTVLQVPAAADTIAAATIIGLTPTEKNG